MEAWVQYWDQGDSASVCGPELRAKFDSLGEVSDGRRIYEMRREEAARKIPLFDSVSLIH
jgi:hypothetical protein